ncbi:MAG: nickel pincer cofactor biosynthesis protein LarB [Candidatus Tritonobacter lacicola]|nr:nickel pincer cofactor biosynthesis protein LarB [Candidatus Tritonobacter lacicola]
MDEEAIRRLFLDFQRGDATIDDAVERLRRLPFHDLRFAKVDHHRALRKGFPEVIYCPGKSPEQIDSIAKEILEGADTLLATRAGRETYEMIRSWCPDAVYHEEARAITVERRPLPRLERPVAVISAGTSDIPVAEEAAVTAEITGSPVERIYDVGVAGLHRLLDHRGEIMRASVVVAVAGMEGALPSVVAGMVAAPVIAVPTSVGYGASFGGLAALLAMMNSCASGVVVVNIDNGFGAGYAATLMNRLACHR